MLRMLKFAETPEAFAEVITKRADDLKAANKIKDDKLFYQERNTKCKTYKKNILIIHARYENGIWIMRGVIRQ